MVEGETDTVKNITVPERQADILYLKRSQHTLPFLKRVL